MARKKQKRITFQAFNLWATININLQWLNGGGYLNDDKRLWILWFTFNGFIGWFLSRKKTIFGSIKKKFSVFEKLLFWCNYSRMFSVMFTVNPRRISDSNGEKQQQQHLWQFATFDSMYCNNVGPLRSR